MMQRKRNQAWVVAVDMGYGHQRAALPLQGIAKNHTLITANEYKGIPNSDKNIWKESQRFYDIVSRFKRFPVLGDFVFSLFDKFQEIRPFYANNEHIESPTFQLRQVYRLMAHKGWGKHLIQKLNADAASLSGRQGSKEVPFVTTFFIPAYMAEFWGYKGPIYVVVPDTDVSRAWAPVESAQSKIIYCVPTERVGERLEMYGVRKSHIVQTGFPLPQEFTAHKHKKAIQDVRRRIMVLDQNGRYVSQYGTTVRRYLGAVPKQKRQRHSVHVAFAIGGAGAQSEIARDIMRFAHQLIADGVITLHIIAGVHAGIAVLLKHTAQEYGLSRLLENGIYIHTSPNKEKYFQNFNRMIRTIDIMWTKPSELVFYAGLGIPLLLSSPVGSQEKSNREWILRMGAGVDQKPIPHISEWLPDFLEDGIFAEAAMQGFIKIPKDGTQAVTKLVCG